MIELVSSLAGAIEDGKIASIVYMDLRKASDVVDHELLLNVLETFGIRGVVNELIRSFLSNRTQAVKIGDAVSTPLPIKTGVVQGSCLGPLLFLMFINAIGLIKTRGQLYLFADDAALVNIHDRSDNIQELIREDMQPILAFFAARKMSLNASKTKFMIVRSRRQNVFIPPTIQLTESITIESASSFKYLGLTIHENLTWNDHLSCVERKVAGANGILLVAT